MIRKAHKKDYVNFIFYCQDYADKIGNDKIIQKIFRNAIKRDDWVYINEQNEVIRGAIISKKSNSRRFLQVLSVDYKIVVQLFQVLCWSQDCDFWIQVNKTDALLKLFKKFKFFKQEENETDLILCRRLIREDYKRDGRHNHR